MSKTQDLIDKSSAKLRMLDYASSAAERVLDVCGLLESLADDLPKRSAPVWREAQTQCQITLHPHFLVLTRFVMPTLMRSSKENDDRQELLLRFNLDCAEQLHNLSDLDDLLTYALEDRGPARDAEALGYALRGYFDELRRNIAWETEVIWPLAARALRDEDIAKILEALGPPDATVRNLPDHADAAHPQK